MGAADAVLDLFLLVKEVGTKDPEVLCAALHMVHALTLLGCEAASASSRVAGARRGLGGLAPGCGGSDHQPPLAKAPPGRPQGVLQRLQEGGKDGLRGTEDP